MHVQSKQLIGRVDYKAAGKSQLGILAIDMQRKRQNEAKK